ncbi:tetratricopeptide repeat protein [Nostoc sp.]|uniref:tetratricopeptide repeat protein n=1 Tax=Nostoc sp. TaxID=1180 RepID=UPI002FF37655
MNSELLQKLAKAQTDEERSWIVTESFLLTLSPELAAAVWAAVVPHWFNAEILAALCPELQTQSSQLYTELQALPFVEEFPDRGHNVHDLTRNLMLKHLRLEPRDEFITLSQRAVEYFGSSNEQPETQIEWLYHLVVVDSEWKGSELWDLAQNWDNNFRVAELESLITALLEQIAAERVATPAKAEVYYWAGKAKFRVYRATEALELYEASLAFYRDTGSRWGEANTLRAIGDVLQFLDRRTEALECYEAALAFYRDIGARLGEANTLVEIGDVLQFLKRSTEALERYEAALAFYRNIGARLGEANTLKAIGDVLQFLDRRTEALERYEASLAFYRDIGDRLGEANTLKAIGDVLQFLKRSTEALERYEAALAFYRDIGDRLGEANTLKAIGDVLQFLDRRTEALERYEASLAFYRDIGDRLGEANTLRAIGDVLQFLKRSTEALERYEAALAFYRDIGARLGEANTLIAIGILQENLTLGLEYCQAALELYTQIGDKYSQSRNLIYFTSEILLKLGRQKEAVDALNCAIELAREIHYQIFVEDATAKLQEIQENHEFH